MAATALVKRGWEAAEAAAAAAGVAMVASTAAAMAQAKVESEVVVATAQVHQG